MYSATARANETFNIERFRRNNSFITAESMLQGNTQAAHSKVYASALNYNSGPGCSKTGERYPPDKSLSSG